MSAHDQEGKDVMAEQTGSTITIDADPGEVMDVIADVTAYPHWDTNIAHADILEHEAGRPTQVRVQAENAAATDVQIRDYQWHGNQWVTWTLHSTGSRTPRSTHAAYTLTPTADGGHTSSPTPCGWTPTPRC